MTHNLLELKNLLKAMDFWSFPKTVDKNIVKI